MLTKILKKITDAVFGPEESEEYVTQTIIAETAMPFDMNTEIASSSMTLPEIKRKHKGVKKMIAKFEVFKGGAVDRQWYWRLLANNGQIIAQSEGYSRRRNALKGIESVKTNAKRAKIVDVEE